MPSFFSDLRRRSRANFKADKHDTATTPTDSGSSHGSHQDTRPEENNHDLANIAREKSSSTLNSAAYSPFGRSADQSAFRFSRSQSSSNLTPNGAQTPPFAQTPPLEKTSPWGSDKRPAPPGQANRYSIAGSLNGSPRIGATYTSPLAPRVASVSDGSWVHQKVLLINGTLGESQQPMDGTVTITHHQDTFPPTSWPVSDSHFKALVHLQPGPNRLRLDYTPPRRPSQGPSSHSSTLYINYLPLVSTPPLHLAILVAKDSPMTFDAMPERARTEGNNIDTAIRKYRMAAYLWQAFTGEQMNRNGFGRRCYRYEEEWQPGTLSSRDFQYGQMRNEAKIHVIRMDKTVAEIQDLNIAQQYEPAKDKGALFGIALDTCRNYFNHKSGQKQYVSCLFLDAHWDKRVGVIRGHAAVGGGADGLQIAICGSHALQSYPAHIEEVVPAFTDCTRTDTDYVANDLNESGSNWEAANIGIGAHMHETGHLFGCPHQESGVMLRDYVTLNRTFTTREPYSTRTKSSGMRLCQISDECAWHRLDILRFRTHPCFQLPSDSVPTGEEGINVWAVDNGVALITAATGIGWIEIYKEGDDVCHHWIEYIDQLGAPSGAPRQISVTEEELRQKIGPAAKGKKISIKVFSCGGSDHEVPDFAQLVGKTSRLKLQDGRFGYRGSKLGFSQMDGSKPQDLVLDSACIQTKLLVNVKVYHGSSVDGLEFCYEDGSSQLWGKRGGKPGGDDFVLDTRRGEAILGYYLRAGAWIDGIQILTNMGRRSELFGNPTGGSGHTLIPPRGYQTVGIYGSHGPWVDGFGLIIAR